MYQNCSNCGATVRRSEDGRTIECTYCGASEMTRVDPQALASSLRTDKKSMIEFLDQFARTFAEAFPEETEIGQKGFLRKETHSVTVRIEPFIYRLHRRSGRIEAERQSIVRGITLKTEQMHVDAWIEELCSTLSEMASSSARAREALKRLGS